MFNVLSKQNGKWGDGSSHNDRNQGVDLAAGCDVAVKDIVLNAGAYVYANGIPEFDGVYAGMTCDFLSVVDTDQDQSTFSVGERCDVARDLGHSLGVGIELAFVV